MELTIELIHNSNKKSLSDPATAPCLTSVKWCLWAESVLKGAAAPYANPYVEKTYSSVSLWFLMHPHFCSYIHYFGTMLGFLLHCIRLFVKKKNLSLFSLFVLPLLPVPQNPVEQDPFMLQVNSLWRLTEGMLTGFDVLQMYWACEFTSYIYGSYTDSVNRLLFLKFSSAREKKKIKISSFQQA